MAVQIRKFWHCQCQVNGSSHLLCHVCYVCFEVRGSFCFSMLARNACGDDLVARDNGVFVLLGQHHIFPSIGSLACADCGAFGFAMHFLLIPCIPMRHFLTKHCGVFMLAAEWSAAAAPAKIFNSSLALGERGKTLETHNNKRKSTSTYIRHFHICDNCIQLLRQTSNLQATTQYLTQPCHSTSKCDWFA